MQAENIISRKESELKHVKQKLCALLQSLYNKKNISGVWYLIVMVYTLPKDLEKFYGRDAATQGIFTFFCLFNFFVVEDVLAVCKEWSQTWIHYPEIFPLAPFDVWQSHLHQVLMTGKEKDEVIQKLVVTQGFHEPNGLDAEGTQIQHLLTPSERAIFNYQDFKVREVLRYPVVAPNEKTLTRCFQLEFQQVEGKKKQLRLSLSTKKMEGWTQKWEISSDSDKLNWNAFVTDCVTLFENNAGSSLEGMFPFLKSPFNDDKKKEPIKSKNQWPGETRGSLQFQCEYKDHFLACHAWKYTKTLTSEGWKGQFDLWKWAEDTPAKQESYLKAVHQQIKTWQEHKKVLNSEMESLSFILHQLLWGIYDC